MGDDVGHAVEQRLGVGVGEAQVHESGYATHVRAPSSTFKAERAVETAPEWPLAAKPACAGSGQTGVRRRK
jgi:hypothetical protein